MRLRDISYPFLLILCALLGTAIGSYVSLTQVKGRLDVLEKANLALIQEVAELKPVVVETVQPVVEESEVLYTDYPACSTTSTFKSYMDYRKITNRSSKQYALQQEAYTGKDGLRYVDDRIMVAMAGRSVGDILDITLEDGTVLEVIIGDIKGNTKCAHSDGSILEFIVDTRVMDPYVKKMGSYNSVYRGVIKNIRLYM